MIPQMNPGCTRRLAQVFRCVASARKLLRFSGFLSKPVILFLQLWLAEKTEHHRSLRGVRHEKNFCFRRCGSVAVNLFTGAGKGAEAAETFRLSPDGDPEYPGQ